ncbi:tripartite tricarboxylate transporter permease [Aminivibrio sp.]|uniref:tripartite tricarboxylate transporter permease n=1 Tax=Aminivibrio sp. TaxID=1872489 RepID=UPI003D99A577
MDIFAFDLLSLFTWQNVTAILMGVLIGISIGMMPGLGPTVGVALVLPVTYTMSTVPAILLLVALYQAAEYGGSISAITLGIPGTASAVATTLDGNPMSKKGYPGKALGYSLYASFCGGLFGGVLLLVLIGPLTKMAIRFSDPEIFLIALLGLVSVVGLGSKDIPKSIISVIFGLLLSTVGIDVFTGVSRFTLDIPSLSEGIPFVALITGLFAVPEVINLATGNLGTVYVSDTKNLRVGLSLREFRPVIKTILKGSVIGSIIGIIPGVGPSAATWISYAEAKRSSKTPEEFGKGAPEGIAAPESANNACVGGALLPLLSLGIPGSGTIAVISSAFIIKGIQPGPQVFQTQPDLILGIIWGFILATFVVLVVGKYATAFFARLLTIPNYVLLTIVFFAAMIGAYGTRFNLFDVGVAFTIGTIGFFLSRLDYSFPCFVMAFILGNLIEVSLRRSLMLSRGSYAIFFTRSYSIAIMVIIAAVVFFTIYSRVKKARQEQAA